MTGNSAQPVPGLVDRSPFEAAEAVVQAVLRHCPRLDSEEAVWREFVTTRASGDERYFDILRRTRHSVFYSQLQRLYAFANETCPDAREELCFVAGRIYADSWCERNLHELLRAALAKKAEFQETMVALYREVLYRTTGAKYTLRDEIRPREIVLRITHRWPSLMQEYFEAHLLDPETAFDNSVRFIGGAAAGFAARTTEGFDAEGVRLETSGNAGTLHLPISATMGFAYPSLVPGLLEVIRRIEGRRRDDEELDRDFVTGSPAMSRTWDLIRRASRADDTVLLRGESGTGKTFIARKIHGLSDRRDRPFIVVGVTSDVGSENMVQSDLFGHERAAFTGATSRKHGLFSLADGGTIFLDEIGDASPELQAKLLRVLEEGAFKRLGGTHDLQVDVRVIAATNRDLERMRDEGTFRPDLYYRLDVISIRLPPLRERVGDIGPLALLLLARAAARRNQAPRTLGPGLLERLERHDWPGNVRELDNVLRSASALSDGPAITGEALDASLRRPGPPALPPSRDPSRRRAAPGPIDEDALRRAIRASDAAGRSEPTASHEDPAHIDFAKRAYLSALIEAYGGSLADVAKRWDRSAEKTLRKLIETYGLGEQLAAARARRRQGSR